MLKFILQWWIAFVFTGIVSAIAIMFKVIGAYKAGLRALLRGEIIKTYHHCIRNGYALIYELENIEEMYKSYKALKGNGMIDNLIGKLKELPTELPKED